MTAELYPAFFNLEGRRCVVVGGGAVAERKMQALLGCRASVVVVASRVTRAIVDADEDGKITLLRRAFEPRDVVGALFVFAATDSREVNANVLREAHAAGALVNAADDPPAGDFHVPATVRRGDVVAALSTGGRSPTFARYLRLELASWLTEERVELSDLLAEARREFQESGRALEPEQWRGAVDEQVLDALRTGDRSRAKALLLARLGAPAAAAGG